MQLHNLFLVPNLHCSSCVDSAKSHINKLKGVSGINVSLENHTVEVIHDQNVTSNDINKALKKSGFISISQKNSNTDSLFTSSNNNSNDNENFDKYEYDSYTTFEFPGYSRIKDYILSWKRARYHKKHCKACQAGITIENEAAKDLNIDINKNKFGKQKSLSLSNQKIQQNKTNTGIVSLTSISSNQDNEYKALLAVNGMTCASCVNAITDNLKSVPSVIDISVDLMSKSAQVIFSDKNNLEKIIQSVQDSGYDCDLVELTEISKNPTYKVLVNIGGMTCASCVSSLTHSFEELAPQIKSPQISLMNHSGSFIVTDPKHDVHVIKQIIIDSGYDCGDIEIKEIGSTSKQETRSFQLRVDGMYCPNCPQQISNALLSFGEDIQITSPISLDKPILEFTYIPKPPEITIRKIVKKLTEISSQYNISIVHRLSLEERARNLAKRERNALLARLVLSIAAAIPTLIIGVIFMSVLSSSHPLRIYVEQKIWAGNVARADWALFITATPVYFFAADVFHRKAYKEIYSIWFHKAPWTRRLFRFGSMNLLMCLGTSIAYWASLGLLIAAATSHQYSHSEGFTTTYFDSVVFLTMFLLIGRILEAYSKEKASSALSMLGSLRPSTARLVEVETKDNGKEIEVEKEVPIDYLEIGDKVHVHPGMTPAGDYLVISGSSEFNEATLTGESQPVFKAAGDVIYAGTSNVGKQTVTALVNSTEGNSVLDQIVNAVREGQLHRAPIERVADILTGYFVPLVCAMALIVWFIWLGLGLGGELPQSYLDVDLGGWPVWSLQFSIAVFVIACPCGIGLAAPTALTVGSGIAAKFGIIARGGGESFQEGSKLDIIVFDKTGTLTLGGNPKITDSKCLLNDSHVKNGIDSIALVAAQQLEIASTHPLGTAFRDYVESLNLQHEVTVKDISETAGRGLKGKINIEHTSVDTKEIIFNEVIIGNEKWMCDNKAFDISDEYNNMIHEWKKEGKSIIYVALSYKEKNSEKFKFNISHVMAAADVIRPEASEVINEIKKRNIQVWMISGDNEITAKAVAEQVGIPEENVIAGVLPQEKASNIKILQKTGGKANKNKKTEKKSIVAMVGDGINDAPSLASADVGIAIGSGSDIALSSAKFILVKSDLRSILVLIDLSKVVFHRILFNFAWALVYNCIGIPIAAGVIYPYHNSRLAPAWASLAMALSSVSVVCSSLLLKLYRPKNVLN